MNHCLKGSYFKLMGIKKWFMETLIFLLLAEKNAIACSFRIRGML
jgi:hypothetical protein